jgi:uncharacterized repeat protein (TIGR01451 family)
MKYTKILVSLVAVLAVVAFLAINASAYVGTIDSVEVAGVTNPGNIAAFAGDTLPVRVTFTSDSSFNDSIDDVRVKVWISGSQQYSAVSGRFDVLPGRTYTQVFNVQLPFAIDPSEDLELKVTVEGRNSGDLVAPWTSAIAAQRESYFVQVLDVAADTQVKAGSNLALDVVLKNRGRQFAEDTFVIARIPSLGVEKRAYFGDLSAVDQSDPNKEDAVSGRLFLTIPSGTPAGIYTVEIQAINADSDATVTKKVMVVGASADSIVVSSVNTKTFAVGEQGTYSLTLVNSGNNVRLYQLVFETPSGLTVSADDTVIAVPAGTSRTTKVSASSSSSGTYNFAAAVYSDGQLVKKEAYTATIQGNSIGGFGNATVLLTVVLAIIFVVLLVVLIVLLTRKPQKSEEFGESYY